VHIGTLLSSGESHAGVLASLIDTCVHGSYGVYIWPAFFLWGLDRTIRLLRIVLVNSQLFTSITQTTDHMKSKRQIPTEATVSVFSPHFLRILVDAPPYLTCRPGQSIYLTIVGAYPMSITEAHPFTVANTPLDGALITDDAESHSKLRLMFIVRVREGFTKRLLDSVLAAPDSSGVSRSFKLFVDGPYGSPPVLRGFESVLFIAGQSPDFSSWFLLYVLDGLTR
jgi:predicted ferric reductase